MPPMLPVCALVFASLCIRPGDLEITNTWSMVVVKDHGFSADAVKRRGVEIEAMESDNYNITNGLFLDRACADGWCLNYTRHCAPTSCKFEVTSPFRQDGLRGEAAIGTNFTIHARNKAQLRSFMKTLVVALADGDDAPHAYMPLTRLGRESNPAPQPHCSPVVWYEGCPRPRLPMMKRPDHV